MKRILFISLSLCFVFLAACSDGTKPVADATNAPIDIKSSDSGNAQTPVITAEPTPKPTPISEEVVREELEYCFTLEDGAEFKEGPLDKFEVLDTLAAGTEVKVTGAFLDWKRVEVNGVEGYIMADELACAKGYVSAQDVNMRKGPGRDFEVLRTLPDKTEMVILSVGDEWCEIIVDDVHGYIHRDFVGYDHAYVTANEVNVRSLPTTDGEKVGMVHEGEMVSILSTYDGWYRVESSECSGYIIGKYVREAPVITEIDAERGYLTDGGVNFRKGPSTDFSPFKRLKKFTAVTVTGEADMWYRVLIDLGEETKTEGFVSKEFIEMGTPTLYVSAQDVSLRTGPGTNYTIITKVRKNSRFIITEADGDWFKGDVNGVSGYMKIDYLTDKPEGEKTNEFSDNDVYLAAKVAYLEARGSSADAYAAVANVIYNRVKSRMFPNTISGVCFQSGQFSVIHHKNWDNISPNSTCLNAVRECLNGGKRPVPMRVLFFHASYLGTSWGSDKEFYKTIGPNSFFWYIG